MVATIAAALSTMARPTAVVGCTVPRGEQTNMHRVLVAVTFATVLLSVFAPVAFSQSANQCQAGHSPQFVFGFAELQKRLGDWMGFALTCEFPDPNATGDIHQRTTKGLAFWRKSTNTPTFTNGTEHWALSSRGFLFWRGSSIDPPADAVAAHSNPATLASAPQPPPPPPGTLATASAADPGLFGETPEFCDWDTHWGGAPAYLCIYPNGGAAFFQRGAAGAWTLLASAPNIETPFTYTDAGRRSLNVPVIPSGNGLPAVPPYRSDSEGWCFTTNASCNREARWDEWNERQGTSYVRYSAIGTGFVTEEGFAEAVDLIWQWPEGKDLLRIADRNHVAVVAGFTPQMRMAIGDRLFP
jgi:hypothetical protein